MNDIELLQLAETCGFDHYGMMNVAALRFEPAVRNMCITGKCGSYNSCWTCPPACGTIEEVAAHARAYQRGILLQTTGQLEDDFDVETMLETEQIQKRRFFHFVSKLREMYQDCLPMSTGKCTICEQCTYPDAPCRAPKLAIPSMEAYGLIVSKTCEDSGLKYYYGPKTLTYTACVLL